MSDALRKALGGLRGDALRAERRAGDEELMIRIGLASARDRNNDHLEEDDPSRPATESNELPEAHEDERLHNRVHQGAARGLRKGRSQ